MSRNLPVPVGPVRDAKRERVGAQGRAKAEAGRATAFVAHLRGRDGARRGLKGGAPVLEQARAAYLDAEYSGEADRRLPAGIFRVAKV
jgi:hypothetical protein